MGSIDQYIGLRLSPDGREVLVTISEMQPAMGTSGGQSRQWGSQPGHFGGPRVVRRVVARRSAVAFTGVTRREVLHAKKTAEAARCRISLTFDSQVYPSDWSLDGKYLAYTANSQGTSDDVWLLAMTGARKPAPLLQSPFCRAPRAILARWPVVGVYVERNWTRRRVRAELPDAAIRRMVSSGGGAYPRWGSGGRELFYRPLTAG